MTNRKPVKDLSSRMIKDGSAFHKVTFANRAKNGLGDQEKRLAKRLFPGETG